MKKPSLALFALLATALLLSVPLALAAPGGRAAEHAHERSAAGMERAAEARAAEAQDEDDGNATAPGADHARRHHGWATAMEKVPAKVRAFFESVLAGASPSVARQLLRLE